LVGRTRCEARVSCNGVAYSVLFELITPSATLGRIMESTATTPSTPHEWVDKTRETFSQVASRADTWDTQVRTFAREKPLAALLCAVAGGYVLARLATWR
jgi:hypothetical protein